MSTINITFKNIQDKIKNDKKGGIFLDTEEMRAFIQETLPEMNEFQIQQIYEFIAQEEY